MIGAARRQQRPRKREGQREDGVLELDHFQNGAPLQLAAHDVVVAASAGF